MKKQFFITFIFSLLLIFGVSAQIPSYVPTEGLVGWWPFNGNAHDESGNGNDGLIKNAQLDNDRFGNSNAAYYFPGANHPNGSAIALPPSDDLDLKESFTISIWANPTEFTESNKITDRVISLLGHQASYVFNAVNYPQNIDLFNVSFYSPNAVDQVNLPGSDMNMPLNRWTHFVVTYNVDSKVIKHYKNGKLVYAQSNVQLNLPVTGRETLIGAGNLFGLFFTGFLDDLGIWDRPLSDLEIKSIYNSEKPKCLPDYVPSDGLVGWWPFCGNANDESGNGNDGVAYGATLTKDRFGLENKAFTLNGKDNYILTNLTKINSRSITMSCWFKTSTRPKGETMLIYSRTGSLSGNGLLLYYYDGVGQSLYLDRSKCYLSSLLLIGYPNLSDNLWHNYVGVITDSLMTIYIDGKQIAQKVEKEPFCFEGKTVFGADLAYPENRFFDGDLDDIGIWNRALTQEEIKNLYYGSSPYTCNIDSLLNPAINYGSVTDIDGNVYPTVKIGDQEWMADNLRTSHYQNGDSILHGSVSSAWNDLKSGAWIYFKNDETYDCPNGKLYNWYAANDSRNLCPIDWHIPTNKDWDDFMNSLGGQNLAALRMKTTNGWTNGSNGTNESGFNSFESGFYRSDAGGIFYGEHFVYWSKTSFDENLATRYWHTRVYGEGVLKDNISKNWGHSIRCVKDRPGQCNLIEKVDPAIVNTSLGSEVFLNAEYNTNDVIFQWQANTAAAGWADIAASDTYKGVNTTRLTINNILISNHMQQLRLVASDGTCSDTSNVAMINIIDTCIVTVYDTIFTTISDTILTTVMDTLLIDVVLSNTADPTSNLIRVYPNPTLSHLVIDAGQYTLMNGYTLTITSGSGATIWTESISQPVYTLDMSAWTGKGLYYLTLKDPQGNIVTTRKIILH